MRSEVQVLPRPRISRRITALAAVPALTFAALRATGRARRRRAGARLWAEATHAAGADQRERSPGTSQGT